LGIEGGKPPTVLRLANSPYFTDEERAIQGGGGEFFPTHTLIEAAFYQLERTSFRDCPAHTKAFGGFVMDRKFYIMGKTNVLRSPVSSGESAEKGGAIKIPKKLNV